MKTAEEFKNRLIELNACAEAREWAEGKTDKEAWEQCERGDWLLWWSKQENQEIRSLTLAKARCAKLVIHLMKDQKSIDAVNAAERFGLGEIELEELKASAHAAAHAAAAAAAYAAADAAYAAYAAYNSAHAAAYAAYNSAHEAAYNSAAHAAAAAAAYAAADAASYAYASKRKEVLKQCADIVRETIKPLFI